MRFRIIASVLAVSFVASGLASASAKTGGAKPDLVVSSISNPPALGLKGQVFAVTDSTRNLGRATSRSSVTQYYLSAGGKRTAVGRRSVVRLKPQRSSRGLSHAMILDSLAPGNYSLVACADGTHTISESNERNNCRTAATTIVVKQPPPPE